MTITDKDTVRDNESQLAQYSLLSEVTCFPIDLNADRPIEVKDIFNPDEKVADIRKVLAYGKPAFLYLHRKSYR